MDTQRKVIMTLRESIEKADKRLELMGFDSIEKAIIFYKRSVVWILTETDKEINDWYESLDV
jgi:hypothetical protein